MRKATEPVKADLTLGENPVIAAELTQREQQRAEALIAQRYDEVGDYYDSRLLYTHSNGWRDNKPTALARLHDGSLRYESIRHDFDRVVPLGDTAVTVGRLRATAVVGGERRQIDTFTSVVWTRREVDAPWTILLFHSSAAPATEQS